ncbi:MAG: SocA family protein [Planctomycetes bacterium]|nr:SocA family protein [Planctomycetota bacterium]
MPWSSKAVANHILHLAKAEGVQVTPMQLNKLVYITHGWHLALTGDPLINETAEAWKYGPVVSSLYQEFKRFGRTPITKFAVEWEGDNPVTAKLPVGAEEAKDIIERVRKAYSGYSGLQLSALTHKKGTPWAKAWATGGGYTYIRCPIPDGDIRDHYLRRSAS